MAMVSLVLALAAALAGCGSKGSNSDWLWAVNIGGPAYKAVDGTQYRADSSVTGGNTDELETIKGSQDAFLYKSYREGDIKVVHPLVNGVYDITLHFAEPEQRAPGERVFDVIAEGQRVINDLDVMRFRDAKVMSALTVTVPNINVTDGELNIEFDASVGEPLLSALVVRRQTRAEHEWQLVWADEFEGPELDSAKWSIDEWSARKVNDEDQAYTARPENLRVEDGLLVIEARKEDYAGAAYTSGRVHSAGKGDVLYGRVEVRARLPAGRGTWSAIWMLPSDPYRYATTCEDGEDWQGSQTCDAWPNSGEIDIMEHVGHQVGHIHGTVHTQAYYWVKWEQRKGRILPADVISTFHVYALEWTPERIDMFVDDSLYFTYVNEHDGWQSWPFDQPFHLVMNVAVGGWWGRSGGGIDADVFPQRMLVDYARVYQRVR